MSLLLGIFCGFSSILLVLILFVCYVNGVPFKLTAIGLEIYLNILRLKFYRNTSEFRITPKVARNACNFDRLSNKPYINILPSTTPSIQFQCFDHILHSRKMKKEQSRTSNPSSPNERLLQLRKKLSKSSNMSIFYAPKHTSTNIKFQELTSDKIACHWIGHNMDLDTKSIQNSKGIIIGIHGGAYIAGNPFMHHSIAALLRYASPKKTKFNKNCE